MELIQLELKYCERCGSLWVRETGSGEIFCFPCVLKMQELPRAGRTRFSPRMGLNHRVDTKASGLYLVPICGEGGTA